MAIFSMLNNNMSKMSVVEFYSEILLFGETFADFFTIELFYCSVSKFIFLKTNLNI